MLLKSDQGPIGFSRGLGAAIPRNAVWSGVYFGSIKYIIDTLPKAETHGQQLAVNFVAGCLGGVLATTANTPFDVPASRMRNWLPGEPKMYRCVWGTCGSSWRVSVAVRFLRDAYYHVKCIRCIVYA